MLIRRDDGPGEPTSTAHGHLEMCVAKDHDGVWWVLLVVRPVIDVVAGDPVGIEVRPENVDVIIAGLREVADEASRLARQGLA